VFHTALPFAYTGQVEADLARIALDGTANVLNAAKATSVPRVVMTSSSIVFGYAGTGTVIDESEGLATAAGQPAYVDAKLRQDREAARIAGDLGVELVRVCPTMAVGAFGPRLGPSNGIVVQYLSDPLRMTYPGGCNIVAAVDVGIGHVLAAEFGRPGEHYVLGSENLTWTAIHEIVAELSGVDRPRVMLNRTTAYLAASTEELLARVGRRPPVTTRDQASMVGRYYWYSHERAAELGYTPVPARDALAAAIAWLASSRHISRETRTSMHLHPDVYAARRDTSRRETVLRARREVV
jgi:dihydroflavonol-4-reductase